MKFKDKISVIIPTYNRAKLIKKSINSILNQTYDNIEVIVVDDCSTDNTEEVIKKIKDDRIRYIKLKKNSGACAARNAGIKVATGKYINFNDSDDEYLPTKIETQYNNLIKNNSDMDFCRIMIHINNNEFPIPSEQNRKKILKKEYIDELINGNYISTPTMLIKSKIIKKVLFDEQLPRFQDYDLVLRMIPGIKVSYTDEILINVYNSKDSISNSNERLLSAVKIMINKKYDINPAQASYLRESLVDMYSNIVINSYNNQIIQYNNQLQNVTNDCKKAQIEYEDLLRKYNEIINSKRWKLINKIFKLFRR